MAYRRTAAVEQRLEDRRAAIAAAAIALLSDHGYRALSIAAVAERAGVATGTVYRHYTDKSELMVGIFRDLCVREVEAVTAASAAGSATGRVAAMVETFAQRALRNPRLAYTLLAEPVDAALDAERLVLRRAFAAAFADAIGHGIATGEFPDQDAGLAAAALVGAVGEVLTDPLHTGTAATGTVPDLVAFALRALGAPQ
ncbi:TetR/AcrR family transcriptional regulator [Rhodococcus phenolicus]|uniref:TetR/AcrR family transcriptional regulator n=1 Tax=Rhodococcus phenolicus TaxID=263849 RepID=UPI00082C394F|nr:TetR/AcrR family transcriptional regulator [Rhodococcus phenolicus]